MATCAIRWLSLRWTTCRGWPTSDGSIVDVAGQLAGRVTVQIMGSNTLDTYLRAVLERAGDDQVTEEFYVLPPGPVTDFDRYRTLLGARMMLEFCDREYTPLVIDTGVPVVESGEAGVVRERVAEGLLRAGARRLVFNHGNGVR